MHFKYKKEDAEFVSASREFIAIHKYVGFNFHLKFLPYFINWNMYEFISIIYKINILRHFVAFHMPVNREATWM